MGGVGGVGYEVDFAEESVLGVRGELGWNVGEGGREGVGEGGREGEREGGEGRTFARGI